MIARVLRDPKTNRMSLGWLMFFSDQQNLINPRYNSTRICLSPGLTSKLLQEAIEHKLQQIQRKEMNQIVVKKSLQGGVGVKNLPGAKSPTQLMFLDDLNCAGADAFEIQPPLELLRQILSQGNVTVHFFFVFSISFCWWCASYSALVEKGCTFRYPFILPAWIRIYMMFISFILLLFCLFLSAIAQSVTY